MHEKSGNDWEYEIRTNRYLPLITNAEEDSLPPIPFLYNYGFNVTELVNNGNEIIPIVDNFASTESGYLYDLPVFTELSNYEKQQLHAIADELLKDINSTSSDQTSGALPIFENLEKDITTHKDKNTVKSEYGNHNIANEKTFLNAKNASERIKSSKGVYTVTTAEHSKDKKGWQKYNWNIEHTRNLITYGINRKFTSKC